jgi:hypothetical protein
MEDFSMRLGILPVKMALVSGLVLSVSAPSSAKEDGLPDNAPKIFQEVVDCRAITDPAARLTCYDTSVAKLDDAQKKNELFVADKAQVRETRKGLFGLSLPNIKIFGKGDDADEVSEISAAISSVREGQRGYVFTLADGAIWAQTDKKYLGRTPKAGQMVSIRKAALGSFMMNVEGGSGFRAERVNK